MCRVRSEAIQKKLLAEDGLTLARALELPQGIEAVGKQAKELHERSSSTFLQVGRKQNREKAVDDKCEQRRCHLCGRNNHRADDCRFKQAKCQKCGKVGHIAPACRSKEKQPFRRSNHKDNHAIQTGDHEEEMPLFVIRNSSRSAAPIQLQPVVIGKALPMELDTGSAASLITEASWKSMLAKTQLRSTDVVLRSYTGEHIKVLGKLVVDVEYNKQQVKNLELTVVQATGPNLLGRDWLQFDWNVIKNVNVQDPVQRLTEKFRDVFDGNPGTISPWTAKLAVDPEASPKFCKPRPVPFAMREKVDEELARLERIGVLEKVTHSNWATPIVVVPKQDGTIRICGDYRATINASLNVDQ